MTPMLWGDDLHAMLLAEMRTAGLRMDEAIACAWVAVPYLEEAQRDVVRAMLGPKLSIRQIAAKVGLSKSRVHQIISGKDPAKPQYSKDGTRFAKHGLTKESYRALFESQGGACAICSKLFPGLLETNIDHCHSTGGVRGLLCTRCNTGIGQLGDSAERCQSAANYLAAHQLPKVA